MSGMKSRKGHTGTSGEGMPQDRSGNRKAGGVARTRATLLRVALAAALAGLLAGTNLSVARAADDSGADDTFLGKFMEKLGLRAPPDRTADINYSERPPLVVPPTRDLPPPAAGLPVAPDWPNDSAMKTHKHVRSKSPPPAPAAPTVTGTIAPADGSAPPGQTGQNGQPAPAGQTTTTARVPNPPAQPTSWWNPKTWFNREEYATFVAEPTREDLTDPPAGYRTPSPDQPYGVGPERKTKTEQPYTPPVTRQDLPR
jgi:hypothetical protein